MSLMGIMRWPLARVLMVLLAGAFGGLISDLRVEHVEVVHEEAVAWTPIVFSGVMVVACLVTAIVWNNLMRRVMIAFFVAAMAVGGIGFYLHNHGNFQRVLKRSTSAWIDPEMRHPKGPPQTAPLAFAGLGVIGVLASLKRFSRE